jgi:hypothetical protein
VLSLELVLNLQRPILAPEAVVGPSASALMIVAMNSLMSGETVVDTPDRSLVSHVATFFDSP